MQRNVRLTAILALVAAAGLATAAPPEGEPLFERFKAVDSKSHRDRIRILEQAERCIQGARDRSTYRECERRERDARQALRDEARRQRQVLRAGIEARRAARSGPEARL